MEDGKRGWDERLRQISNRVLSFPFSHRFLTFAGPLLFRLALPCYCLPCSIERQTDIRLSHLHTEGRVVLRFFRHFVDYF